nr:ectopic P granules protein 5 homolog [Pocillopora verrucosa]
MEATKPKRKHKRRSKDAATKSASAGKESEASKDATLSTVSEGETSEVTKLSENAFAAEPVTEDSVSTLLPGTSELAEKNEEVLPSQKDENETEDVKELESFNSETKSNVNASVTKDDNESKSSAHVDHSVKDEPEKCSTLENQAVHTSIAQATTGVEMGTDNQIPDQLQKENAIETDRSLIRETLELEYKDKSKDEAQSDVNKPEFMSTLENVVVSESTTQATTGDEIERSRQIPAQVEKTQENETSVTLSSSRSQQDDKVNSSGNLQPQIGDRELPVSNEDVRTPQLYPELDSLAKKSVTSIRQYRMTLEAFSEDHLKTLYFNPLLEQMEDFVEHFIKISKQDDHEFYELVNAYFRGRNALAMAIKEYEIVLAECEKKKEQLWIDKNFSVTAQGKCLDQVNVTHNHSYQQVELNAGVPGEIESMLGKLHKALHETLALQRYTCQLARLHIDMYIFDMLSQSPISRNVSSETLVTELCPVEQSPDIQAEVQRLRDCISVLFMFVRQPIQDEEFVTILNGWMEQLVAVLLRVACLADLVFLLNHLLRCPPGFTSKIAQFIQFPVPQFKSHGYNVVDEPYYWDNPLVHHFVAMLSSLLLPVRERDRYLQKLALGKEAAMGSISWTIVDDDGESLEDEDPETSWVLIQENDLIALFSQFPFDAIFKHLLKMDPNIPNDCLIESHYHVEHTSSRDIMRMLAFASCVVCVMGRAFRTYEKVRYRAFVKRVGRTIRQVVQYVLDHWSDFRSWRVNVCGESENAIPDSFHSGNQYSLQRLQVEVDQFFLRAAQQIISAHRLGAWQFLADMPFRSVSSQTLWKLFWALHVDVTKLDSVESINQEDSMREDWRDVLESRQGEFTDQLARMSQSEAIFLLTTFTNIATSRDRKERELIEAISTEVYKVSFIASQTRESSSKTGRHLLGTISSVHPFVISVLLENVSATLDIIGKACVYLFSGLSVHLWHPTYRNMDCIKSWLLKADLSSPENQLARYIISNLNWGQMGESGEGDKLFLHQCWHRAVAVSLVEVSALRLPKMPGGISHEAFKEDTGLLKQVTLIATTSYNRLMQPNYEQQLYDWLWEVTLSLRLHPADLPTPVIQFTQRLPNEDELEASEEGGPGFASLVKSLSKETLVLPNESSLSSMTHAIKASGQLASYAAVAMTTIGTSRDLFLGEGLDYLTVILNERCFDAALRIIANVTPMFFGCHEKLTQEARFVTAIHRLSQLDNDNAGYAEKLLQASTVGPYCKRLVGIIQGHVQKFQAPGMVGSISVVEFWLLTLCTLPYWYRDVSVQFLIDNLIKIALRIEGSLSVIQTHLMDAYKVLLRETGSQGVIASLFSWVTSSSTAPPVLWEIKASPDYSYYAYCVLCMETQMEENCGLSVEINKRLLNKPDATVDAVLKKVVKKMKLSWTPLVSSLSIYRWANQAMVTEVDHPMLPLIWQRFFSLYLQRPVTEPGLAQRSGVGYRFFDSQSYSSMLKKMKQRLQATAEHHRNRSVETGADHDAVTDGDREISKQFEQTRALHEKLTGFYQTLALWLDEPRLHDPSLYLPSLPPPYDAVRLEALLKPVQEPWFDLIFVKKIDMEITESVRCWVKHALGPQKNPPESKATGQWNDRSPETAASRIVRRMKTHPAPLPPPPVKRLEPILPSMTDATLMNKQKLLGIVYSQLQGIVAHARQFCGLVGQHVSLDIEYIELIPKMYSNEMSQVVVQVPCRKHQCRGPATLTVKFLAKRPNEVMIRKVADNRREQEQVVQNFIQPCPARLCEGAAYIESIITSLVNKAKSSSERNVQEIISDIGTALFYHVTGAMDDSVMNYQPTVQFFTSCVEILGKEFIMNNPTQTEQLLSAILEHTSISVLLVPFFSPNDNPDSFTTMYRRILETADGDLVFSLLTKFEMRKWLSSPNSNLMERSALTHAVFEALSSVGYEPPDNKRSILEVYLRHLSIVLMYNFPEQYSDGLRLLCEGSGKRTLCLDVWDKFLSCIGCVPTNEKEPPTASKEVLGDEQVLETLDWLTKYFSGQRAELGGHVTGGLYTMWRPYIKQLSLVLGFMCQQIVVRRAAVVYANRGQGLEKVLTELWALICRVFEPWICSQESPIPGNVPVAPWNESEVPQAADMINLFTDTLNCLQTHLNAPHSGSSMMNMFWSFFVSSLTKEGIPEYVLRVYRSKFFQLPWQSFIPTLHNMQLMQELYGVCKNSFRFLGAVFPLMDWNHIISLYSEGQTAEAVTRLHSSLFHLLVMFSNEKGVTAVQGSKMPELLNVALAFPWHYLDGRTFEQVVSWQVDNGSAELVLDEKSCIWHALRLIRAAAGIVVSEDGSMQPTRPDTAAKRASYVRCVASLLSKCSMDTKHKVKSYGPVIFFVLKDIESVAGSGVDPASTASEVCMMMSEALNLLNICSPVGDVLRVTLDSILQFIRDTSCTMVVLVSISAACRTLANIQYMVSVAETGIQSFFTKYSPPNPTGAQTDVDGGWAQVVPSVAVPELAQDEFVQECVRQGALLTLYTNILLKLSSCQSPVQEMSVLTDIVTWCSQIKMRREFETKVTLLWHKILQLSVRQVYYAKGPLQDLTKQLSFLASYLHSLGEDKSSAGLLGAIGFGKKSQLSVQFRFMCRALEAFLLAQMPSNSLLRLEAKAPGYVREPKGAKQLAPGGRVISSTAEAEQALNNLETLRVNKQYASLAEHIMEAYSFIANPLNSLMEGPQFVVMLVRKLFQNDRALDIIAV